MTKIKFKLYCLYSLFQNCIAFIDSKPSLQLYPLVYITTEGTTSVTFMCQKLTQFFGTVHFSINGRTISDENYQSGNNIKEDQINSTHYRMILPVQAKYNNSDVGCYSYGEGYTTSNGRLTIQGQLSAPAELTAAQSTEYEGYIKVTWRAPFTLDLTNIDPDILGYEICINPILPGINATKSRQCSTTKTTFFNLLQVNLPVNISVSAINVDGPGHSKKILHEACTSMSQIF